MLSPRAISAIAGRRSHATARSASAVASPDQAGKVGRSTGLLDQAPPHRARDSRGAIRDAELLIEVLHVGLHRREAEVELLRDLGQALPRRDQVQDLLLSRGQRGCIRLLAEPDLRDEPRGDVRRHDVLAPGAGEHGVGDRLAARLLRDEARGADLERPVDDAAVGERGDDQDAGRKLLADDRVRHGDAVELRQLVVEQRNVGVVLLDLGERGASVLGFRDDPDAAAREERPHHSFAVEGMVVGDDHGDPLLALLVHRDVGHGTPRGYLGTLPSVTSTVRVAEPRTTSSWRRSPGEHGARRSETWPEDATGLRFTATIESPPVDAVTPATVTCRRAAVMPA